MKLLKLLTHFSEYRNIIIHPLCGITLVYLNTHFGRIGRYLCIRAGEGVENETG